MNLCRWLLLAAGIASAQNPNLDVAPGRRLFEAQCALCHGQNGSGGRGPTLLKPVLAKAPDDAALERIIATGIPPEMPGAWQLSPNELKQVTAYVRSLGKIAPEIVPGSVEKGREIYAKSGCAGCHIVQGEGSGYGPELSNIGARRNAVHLRQSLVEPAAALPDGFLIVAVTPLAGAKVTGMRLGEDPFTLQLKDGAGRLHSFPQVRAAQHGEATEELPDARLRQAAGERPAGSDCLPGELEGSGQVMISAVFALMLLQAQSAVPFERIANAEKEPGNWLTYSGNYLGHRHSPLTQLTPRNAAGLKVNGRTSSLTVTTRRRPLSSATSCTSPGPTA